MTEQTYRLTQKWPHDAWARLVALAKKRGVSTASLILMIVNDRLDDEEGRKQ